MVTATLVNVGCASRRPVLYPNAQYQSAGKTVAQRDVTDCIRQAEEHGADSGRAGEVARDTAAGAAIGAASAAAWSAARSDEDTGNRVAAGAAAGGAAGLVRGALRARDPSRVHKNFVRRCLRDLGYEVIGWR
jgi:hypothetical protein